MSIALTLVIAVLGLFLYFACTNSKASEVGRIMFWTGLLAFLLRFSELSVAHLLK
jgi:hypothetical protein